MWNQCVIDYRAEEGFEAVKQYRYEWDETKNCFRDRPVHDWTSHPADAAIYLSIAWQAEAPAEPKPQPKPLNDYDYGDDEDEDDWKTG